jgi:hypothetical protein
VEATPIITSQDLSVFNLDHSSDLVFAGGIGPSMQQSRNMYAGVEVLTEPVFIPNQLPFLIPGVESSLHQRLFYHYSRNLSKVPTITVGDSNAMNRVVIPLALRDRTLMDTILCLAGSHLLRQQAVGEEKLLEFRSKRFQLQDEVFSRDSYERHTQVECSSPSLSGEERVRIQPSLSGIHPDSRNSNTKDYLSIQS